MTATVLEPALTPAGIVAVMLVMLTTVTFVAATPSMVTAVAPLKFVPVIVTDVPPASGPEFGVMPEMVGVLYAVMVFEVAGTPVKVTVVVAVPVLVGALVTNWKTPAALACWSEAAVQLAPAARLKPVRMKLELAL